MKHIGKLLVAILVFLAVVIFGSYFLERAISQDCKDSGGVPVKSYPGIACLDAKVIK